LGRHPKARGLETEAGAKLQVRLGGKKKKRRPTSGQVEPKTENGCRARKTARQMRNPKQGSSWQGNKACPFTSYAKTGQRNQITWKKKMKALKAQRSWFLWVGLSVPRNKEWPHRRGPQTRSGVPRSSTKGQRGQNGHFQ